MKTRLSLICCALVFIAGIQTANAQFGVPNGGFGPGGFQQIAGDLPIGTPGRVWFQSNLADRGLGYEGSYLTLGGKTRLREDRHDGRWLFEGRLHHATDPDNGGFFANFGVERVISIHAAGAEVSVGGWFDWDGDEQGSFANTFQSAGVSGKIKTRRFDLLGNGYFPIGTSDYSIGDHTGAECFFGNNIVLQPGINSALQGFDVTLRMRPEQLAHINGTIDIGGYGYSSDFVEYFSGGRARFGFQVLNGMIVSTEVNYDDRFDVTGVIGLGWVFGANAWGNEYAGIGRDLEQTVRNDHIVRVQEDLVLAIDPDTGMPYNVIHVDNSADPLFADGTFETAFTTLAEAEAASSTDDIIFVREGFGTSVGMRDGIVLKDRQMLLGDGVEHLIPIANPGFGTSFILCNDVDGVRPLISGSLNGPAVTLADDNVVRGFVIDGTEGVGGMSYGIHGDGSDNGIIEDNLISGAVLHGIFLDNITGDWTFARNVVSGNAFDGILIQDACDPDSVFRFVDNGFNGNGRDGIHFSGWEAESVTFLRNVTNGNGRDGVRMEGYKGTSSDVTFRRHVASNNLGFGININGGNGNLEFFNSTITNNNAGGLIITDWTNTDPGDRTFIGTTTGGSSTFTGNGGGGGAGIEVIQTVGSQILEITNSTIDNNGFGIRSVTDGVLASLDTSIIDNISVSGNQVDGMRFTALGGSSHKILIDQTGTPLTPLTMTGNGAGGAGNGISFFAGDASGGLVSTIEADVNDVLITGSATNGIHGTAILDGSLDLDLNNSVVAGSGADGVSLFFDTNFHEVINRVNVTGSLITGNGGAGIDLDSLADTYTDLQVIGSTITGSGGMGIDVNAVGSAAVDVDNLTRLFVQGSSVTGNGSNGIGLTSSGDAHLLSQLYGSTITGNGADGVATLASGDSLSTMRMSSNTIAGNAGAGWSVTTSDTADFNAVLINNGIQSMTATNGATSTICLAMSNNGLGVVPPAFVNGGAPGDFRVELDGLTNGFSNADLGPTFSFGPFGSVCEGLVAGEEAAFGAKGFPPKP